MKHHPVRRLTRRPRHWWRETPTGQIGQTLIGIGVVLIVIAALILLKWH